MCGNENIVRQMLRNYSAESIQQTTQWAFCTVKALDCATLWKLYHWICVWRESRSEMSRARVERSPPRRRLLRRQIEFLRATTCNFSVSGTDQNMSCRLTDAALCDVNCVDYDNAFDCNSIHCSSLQLLKTPTALLHPREKTNWKETHDNEHSSTMKSGGNLV